MTPTLYRLDRPNTLLGPATHDPVDRECVRITGGSGRIQNLVARGCGDCVSPNLPAGIKFQGPGWALSPDGMPVWEVRSCRMAGFRMATAPGSMPNGDGMSSELENPDLFFNTCVAEDNADAGFDLKGARWRLHNCASRRNQHNFKFWASGHATGKTISENPAPLNAYPGVHVLVAPHESYTERVVVEIDFLYARGPGTLLVIETHYDLGALPPLVIVRDYDVRGITRVLQVLGSEPEIVWPERGAPKL